MKNLLNSLMNGDLTSLTNEKVVEINSTTFEMLNKQTHSDKDLDMINDILHISNLLYNNCDRSLLPLEDGVYDLLLELYKKYDSNYQIGAEPVEFELNESNDDRPLKNPFIKCVPKEKQEQMLFYDNLNYEVPLEFKLLEKPFEYLNKQYITKRMVKSIQSHPNLVGTLDKCKFVLNSQAEEKGVLEDSNVKILERDFLQKHIEMGIIDYNKPFSMVLELKYDGVSVVGDIHNQTLINAVSRGDTNKGVTADLSPIFRGYKFTKAPNVDISIKFEAIMTLSNLSIYNQMKGKDYKNCRTAISGLIGSSDSAQYRDLVTLIPLATEETGNVNRIDEIELLNEYYSREEYLRYAVIYGNYTQILFQIKRFVEEAEFMRNQLPFMYDGVVVSYVDKNIIDKLGRKNSVNKYSCAIKFNALKKQTVFKGYSYTVGQDGKVTPMIHFNPVEFYGTIHDKSTGHSYERFKNLGLRIGDIIDVEYVNDVMPYITKPDNSYNASNPNPIEEFITHCPYCGSKLQLSESGKTIYCPNQDCSEKKLKRIVNMMDKLNIKDFSEAYLSKIGKYSLKQLFELNQSDIIFLGKINSQKFLDRINELKTREIYDYEIIGSLGFTGVASEKWKLILNKYSIEDLILMNYHNKLNEIVKIKGIGPLTAKTIEDEFDYFIDDIKEICMMPNVIRTVGIESKGKTIRFTGFRDKDLSDYLIAQGHDASDKGVTKSTDILLVPYDGFTSSKTSKAGDNTIIISVQEFKNNLNKYLN